VNSPLTLPLSHRFPDVRYARDRDPSKTDWISWVNPRTEVCVRQRPAGCKWPDLETIYVERYLILVNGGRNG